MAVLPAPVAVLGQVGHEMRWSTWHDTVSQTDEIEFSCTCGIWKQRNVVDPIESFYGKVLKFSGRSLGEVVLKAGISAGRSFQIHLETAQVDVVMWAGQP